MKEDYFMDKVMFVSSLTSIRCESHFPLFLFRSSGSPAPPAASVKVRDATQNRLLSTNYNFIHIGNATFHHTLTLLTIKQGLLMNSAKWAQLYARRAETISSRYCSCILRTESSFFLRGAAMNFSAFVLLVQERSASPAHFLSPPFALLPISVW
jgi:hypothetical protein